MRKHSDPRRVDVWLAMADHFLDTETRHDVPLTALRCLEAGLTLDEARDVWRYEVSRAVGANVWNVAGEWAGWDRDWLVSEIERLRCRWDNRPGTCRWLRYRARVHLVHGCWLAIERCMEALMTLPAPDDRKQLAEDPACLARHYFDLCPSDVSLLTPVERRRIGALYPEPFRRLMAPALFKDEEQPADAKVWAAFEGMTS